MQQSFSHDSTFSSIRRHSISSSEDNLDLEASLASLSQIPESVALGSSVSDIRKSPKRTKPALASLFNLVKPGGSISSIQFPETIWTAKTNYAYDTRILFKRRISHLFSLLTSLRAYVELNYQGFQKILKKYLLSKCTISNTDETPS